MKMESRGESRWDPNSRSYIKTEKKPNQYADVDALIERLEKETPPNSTNSEAVNREINVRNQKLAELKKLRKQAEQVKQAEMDMKRVKDEQEELDRALKTLSDIKEKSSVSMGSTPANFCYASESSESSCSRNYSAPTYSSYSSESSESSCSRSYDLPPAREKTIGHVYIGESVGESRW